MFGLSEEPLGTIKLFLMAGPLIRALERGCTLVIDELDANLHPLVFKKIVELFNDLTVNPRGAQLIFTTHSTNLLASKLLRRDQIWLAEKNTDLATQLRRLSDRLPRKLENLEIGYLSGRYGPLPHYQGIGAQLLCN